MRYLREKCENASVEINLYGLKTIVSEECPPGTIHVITAAPKREEYTSDALYEAAYSEWRKKGLWRAENIAD